jgi:hypothetical protein
MSRIAGEYLSGWYIIERILNRVLTSLVVAVKFRPIDFRESSSVLPTFSTL